VGTVASFVVAPGGAAGVNEFTHRSTPYDTNGTWIHSGDGPWLESSNTQGDAVTYRVSAAAGDFEVVLVHFAGPNRGIYHVEVDGVELGTIDGYAGSGTPDSRGVVAATIASPGPHDVTFRMATKNASSSGYYGLIQGVAICEVAP
jgi:hypothetical protein